MRKLVALPLVVCLALVLAATARAQSGSGSNDGELSGNYAFTFNGITGSSGGASSVFAAVGRFTADGAGNLTNGELDTNTVGTTGAGSESFSGTYSVGADHRGVMTLNLSGSSARLAFAMLANGNAEFIEFDAAGGSGTIGSGTMEKADVTAFSTSRITGDYAFGAAGFDTARNRAALEGRFTSNGTGTLTSAAGDVNAYGTDYPLVFTAANYAVTNSAAGRGTMHLAFTFGGTPDSMNFVFYVVNSGKLFVMESDPVTTATPLLNGAVVQQQIPAGGFSNASLNSNMVIYLTGLSACGTVGGIPKAVAGLLTTSGSGALSLTYDENFCRAPNSVTGAAGTYSVASNGRAAITIGGYSLVAYLVSSNQIFLFVSDSNVLFGVGEPQTAAPVTNGSLSGPYAGFATDPVSFAVTVFSGEFSANGASPTGTMTGTEDIGASGGPSAGVAFDATYSISASPTNGRGSMTVSSGTGGNAVIYMISPSKFVTISLNDPNPAVLLFEQGPAAASTVSLSSLTLSPTSVVGGVQNSTGTVTLSGAAPTGGALVALSSSNTGAAQAPSSVTVPAGASSATFTVTTSAVAASTSATISASYGGATRTAVLTMNPAAVPPSITTQPASQTVTAGQTATFSVKATGTAPLAYQWRKNGMAISGATLSSYTTPPTTTSDNGSQFTVVVSNSAGSVTSSAALLTVTPPPPTLSALTLNPASVVGGLQNATGTVTLSGPASAGGAQVTLSSGNTGVAQVPASVTVPAGSSSASFTVNTSRVTSSISVAISAFYGGVTRTVALTVNAPPLPTVASLTLNPSSVIGGLQSSTGTVTLSGPAPAGGAQVVVSSSNSGVAQVPSIVTVPAGAISTSFTVSTSIVLLSTSANISASYNGSTRTASLSVLL